MGRGMSVGEEIGAKLGPLPVWQWGAIGAAGIVGWAYLRRRRHPKAVAPAPVYTDAGNVAGSLYGSGTSNGPTGPSGSIAPPVDLTSITQMLGDQAAGIAALQQDYHGAIAGLQKDIYSIPNSVAALQPPPQPVWEPPPPPVWQVFQAPPMPAWQPPPPQPEGDNLRDLYDRIAQIIEHPVDHAFITSFLHHEVNRPYLEGVLKNPAHLRKLAGKRP